MLRSTCAIGNVPTIRDYSLWPSYNGVFSKHKLAEFMQLPLHGPSFLQLVVASQRLFGGAS